MQPMVKTGKRACLFIMTHMLLPLQGDITINVHVPRAMPWADILKPFQGIKLAFAEQLTNAPV